MQEEHALLEVIGALPLEEARYKDYTAKRRAASFGFEYDFSYNTIHPAAPIPGFLDFVKTKVAAWLGVAPGAIRHALIAEYRPGTALGWHRDVPNFELVCGVSLAAAARMRFRPYPPGQGPQERALARARAALGLHPARRRALALAAQHSGHEGATLLDHLSHPGLMRWLAFALAVGGVRGARPGAGQRHPAGRQARPRSTRTSARPWCWSRRRPTRARSA